MGGVESVAIPVDAGGFWFIDFPQVWFAICVDDTNVCWLGNRLFYSILSSHQVILNAGDKSLFPSFLARQKAWTKNFEIGPCGLSTQIHILARHY